MKTLKIVLISLVVLLIGVRIYLPYFLIDYVEAQINKLPEYRAKIGDIDVHLYRGSYTIKDFQLWKKAKNIPVPFFEASLIDLSVQWKALLHGKLVAKIISDKPKIHFVADEKGNEQLSIDDQWVALVKSLFPLNVNSVQVNNGEIYFENFNGKPPFKTYIKNIAFNLKNMQNAERENKLLLSQFNFIGKTSGGGKVEINGTFNPFVKTPTFYLKGNLNQLAITELKDLLKHYTSLDVVGGTFTLYGEVGASKGEIKGYVKPFLKNLKIGDPKKENIIGQIYNGAASVVASVLQNNEKETIATKVKLEGKIDDPNTSILSIIGYLLRHAFIEALIPRIDDTIKPKDVMYGLNKSKENQRYPQYHT